MARKRKKEPPPISAFRIKKRWTFAALCAIAIIVAALFFMFVEAPPVIDEDESAAGFRLQEASFNDLTGFNDDNLLEAAQSFRNSCKVLVKRPISYYADQAEWARICKDFLAEEFTTSAGARRFFKNNFKPYKVSFNGKSEGLFTGYYVPLLKGSHQKTKDFTVPVYAPPRDIVYVNVEDFIPECKKCKIIGQVKDNNLKPYPHRKEIDSKEINAEVLVWLKDPVDNFILHIQGSGKVEFEDGTRKTIGYASYNGHKFVGVGNLMIKDKLIASGDYSMPSIRKWLQDNPKKAKEIMWQNPRYVFFRVLDTDPVGAQGVQLTARRSLAVDPSFISYGVPIWLMTADGDREPLRQMVIAQDTGGAIRGAVRGDFFWGEGDDAFIQAGRMKSQGEYFVLLPARNHFNKGRQ